MYTLKRDPLHDQLKQVERDFLEALSGDSDSLMTITAELSQIQITIEGRANTGSLDSRTAAYAFGVVESISAVSTTIIRLDRQLVLDLASFSEDIDNILSRARSQEATSSDIRRGSRVKLPDQSIRTADLTPLTPPTSPAPDDLDPVRTWLLANLHHPFPSPSEKTHLAHLASRPRGNIETDLTNYRRRSGWTDFKNKWCGGDTSKARDVIWGWMVGNEVEGDIKKDLEDMKGYVERREATKVGGWIETLAEKAREMLEGKGASITEIEKEDEEEVEDEAVATLNNPFPTPPLSAKTSADSLSAVSSHIPKSNKRNVSDSSSVSAASAQTGMAFNFQPLQTPNKRSKGFQGGTGMTGKGKKRVGKFEDEGRDQKMRFEGPEDRVWKEEPSWTPITSEVIQATPNQYTPPVNVTPPRSHASPPVDPELLSTPPNYHNNSNTYTPPYHPQSSPYQVQESPYHPNYHPAHLAPTYEQPYTYHPDTSSPYGLTPYPVYYHPNEHHHQSHRYSQSPVYPVHPHQQPVRYASHPDMWSTDRPIPQYLSHIQPVSDMRSTPSPAEGHWIGGDHRFDYQAERVDFRAYRQ